ncbi:hypothetical protein, partial [Novilysobacter selenitireducens]
MANKPKKKRSASPISRSLQENFRGFSYTASESFDQDGWSGLRARMREEDELERMRETDGRAHAEAVGDDEIPVVSSSPQQQPIALEGAF